MMWKKKVGKAHRYLVICACIVIFACCLAVYTRITRPVVLTIYAFDDCGGCYGDGAPCQPCTTLDALYQTFYEVLERVNLEKRSTIQTFNTKVESGQKALEEICAALGLSPQNLEMPLVVLDGKEAYSGRAAEGQVAKRLESRRLSALFAREKPFEKLSEKAMLYFTTDLCGECSRARKYLSEAQVGLANVGVSCAELSIDEEQNYALLASYLVGYGVENHGVSVPYLFWGGNYYYGSDAIGAALAPFRERE